MPLNLTEAASHEVFDLQGYPKIQDYEELARIELAMVGVPADMQLKWDAATETLSIGRAKFTELMKFKTQHAFASHILREHKIAHFSYHPKWFNKMVSSVVRGSLPQLYKMWKGAQYKYFVAPHIDIIKKISWKQGGVNSNALKHIRANRKILQEVFEDGLYQLLPVVAVTGKLPKDLKKEFGSSWKTIANNSLNKNKALVRNVVGSLWKRVDQCKDKIAVRAHLPSTVLKEFELSGADFLEHVAAHYKGEWSTRVKSNKETHARKWEGIAHYFTDTKHMAEQLGEKFNPLWTPRKLKEKHDKWAKDVLRKEYSPDKFEWVAPLPQSYEYEGYTATLLDSALLIAIEGSEMGHCVGSYAGQVANKKYLVYSVSRAGERSSTIGITVRDWKVDKGNYFYFNQHYGRFNQRLVDAREMELGTNLIKLLNGEDI